jgi:uncharacterized protein (DUF58 family)
MELVARTVVDGFVAGLHRSPDFGFSQEFAEYRSYTPGDDLRHIDWNVFARTERTYLKRYRGETNTAIHVLLDVSASMGFGTAPVKKISYAKFLASAIVYLAHLQRDSASLIVFHEELANFVPASSRSGQLMRLLHAIDQSALGQKTNYERPLFELQQFLKRRGVTVLISDFFDNPEAIVRTVEPLRFRGNEVILFHVLDRGEIEPSLGDAPLLVDMETGEALETSPDYARSEYGPKMAAHIESLRKRSEAAGLDYFLLRTDRPLDAALREYFSVREGRM